MGNNLQSHIRDLQPHVEAGNHLCTNILARFRMQIPVRVCQNLYGQLAPACPRHRYLFVFFEPRLIKRVFLHNEVDDVSGDVFATYIFPALAVRPWGIGGGGMHADAEDEGEYGKYG